jgi:hypothetical protein
MELSILAAKIICLIFVLTGIGGLSGKIDFNKMVGDFEKSVGLTFIAGIYTLVIGALLVNYHNIWAKDWTVLVTIIGWIALVKGCLLIIHPQFIRIGKGVYRNAQLLGAVMLILGAIFGYFGFIA